MDLIKAKAKRENDQLTELSECLICYEVYNSTSRAPMSMPCGHTLCHRCLKKVSDGFFYHCPSCRRFSFCGFVKLEKNYLLIELLSAFDLLARDDAIENTKHTAVFNPEGFTHIEPEHVSDFTFQFCLAMRGVMPAIFMAPTFDFDFAPEPRITKAMRLFESMAECFSHDNRPQRQRFRSWSVLDQNDAGSDGSTQSVNDSEHVYLGETVPDHLGYPVRPTIPRRDDVGPLSLFRDVLDAEDSASGLAQALDRVLNDRGHEMMEEPAYILEFDNDADTETPTEAYGEEGTEPGPSNTFRRTRGNTWQTVPRMNYNRWRPLPIASNTVTNEMPPRNNSYNETRYGNTEQVPIRNRSQYHYEFPAASNRGGSASVNNSGRRGDAAFNGNNSYPRGGPFNMSNPHPRRGGRGRGGGAGGIGENHNSRTRIGSWNNGSNFSNPSRRGFGGNRDNRYGNFFNGSNGSTNNAETSQPRSSGSSTGIYTAFRGRGRGNVNNSGNFYPRRRQNNDNGSESSNRGNSSRRRNDDFDGYDNDW